MSNPDYRAMCAELAEEVEHLWSIVRDDNNEPHSLANRARTLLDQPVAEGPKPVVDYSRVPEIATEAQIRSAAQYLVKKRNCDGDLIPAIEYAIARWGRPTPQPVAPTDEDLEDLADVMNVSGNPVPAMRRALELWGRPTPQLPADGEVAELVAWLRDRANSTSIAANANRASRIADLLEHQHPQPVATSERLPGPEDCIFPAGECWWFDPHADGAWYLDTFQGNYTHWLPAHALPTPEATND